MRHTPGEASPPQGCRAPAAHLQHDGELLRGVAVLHAHGQPHLERRQLLRKERAVLLEDEWEGKFGLKKNNNEANSFGTYGLAQFIVSKNYSF